MRHRQATLGHHLHQVTQTDLEPEIPPNAQDDDFAVEVATLEQLLHDLQLAHCRPQLVQHTNLADPTAPFAPEPILSVGIKCQVRIRVPATSDRQFGGRAEKTARAPKGAECSARSGEPFQDAGRKTTPSSGSPVVTKRQSAMISLRASATIMILRVPIRLSAVRARYHNASMLSF